MTSLLLRMVKLLQWSQKIIRYEYFPMHSEVKNKLAWLRESDEVLDEIRQRMGM